MFKISVIIPIYNTEKFLCECLDSIITQTLRDIEIICVNNCSTDNSLKILEDYGIKDNRIKIINVQTQGAGLARNYGIEIASGEYIAFMDSDDVYPSKDILEQLYDNAKKHNVSICGGEFSDFVNDVTQKNTVYKKNCAGYIFENDGYLNYDEYQFDYGFTRFIYKKQLLIENNIKFPNYKRFEDPPFLVKAMIAGQKFYAIKKIVYSARQNYKNINWDEKSITDSLFGIEDNLKIAEQYKYKKLSEYTLMRFKDNYAQMWFKMNLFNLKQIINLIKLRPKVFYICFYCSVISSILKNLFSITNEREYKIITICGLKIKIPRKRKYEKK